MQSHRVLDPSQTHFPQNSTKCAVWRKKHTNKMKRKCWRLPAASREREREHPHTQKRMFEMSPPVWVRHSTWDHLSERLDQGRRHQGGLCVHINSHECCEFSCSRRSPAIHMLKKWDSINTWIYSWHLLPGSSGVCMNVNVFSPSPSPSLQYSDSPRVLCKSFLFKARVIYSPRKQRITIVVFALSLCIWVCEYSTSADDWLASTFEWLM